MTSDLDTYRAAHLLIKRHGDDAPIEAATRLRLRPRFRADFFPAFAITFFFLVWP